jgi:hypothetical protein
VKSLKVHDLTDYMTHVERYGPECVLETVSQKDVGKLRAFIESKERVFEFKRGQWVERKGKAPRACALCGLDLPPGSSVQTRYHSHCRSTAASRRRRAKTGSAAAGGALPPVQRLNVGNPSSRAENPAERLRKAQNAGKPALLPPGLDWKEVGP